MPNYFSGSYFPKTFTKAGLPAANSMQGAAVFVSDTNELAWSNGTSWRFMTNLGVSTQTGTFTVDLSVNGTLVLVNVAAPLTLSLPNSAPVGFSFGVMQYGSGQVTFGAAAGSTLRALSGTKTISQYGVIVATCITNSNGTSAEWWISGDATA